MKFLKTLLATAVVVSAVPAMAYEAGDIMVKAGAVKVTPKDGNTDSSAVTSAVLTSVTGSPVNEHSELDVQSNTQLGLTLVYMVTSNIGVEVLGATPFEHEVKIDGGALNGTVAAKTKHLPPTVSVQYYPLSGQSAVQPYVGLGINHTFFFDEEDSAKLGTGHLKKSTGLAYSVGVNYDINDEWLVNAAVWKMDIDTEIVGGAADGAEVEIDPTVVFVGLGYKF